MFEILLQVLDRLIQFRKYRSQKFRNQFDLIVEPTFSDLEKVHTDYLRMFTDASSMLRKDNRTPGEVVQVLEKRRLEFEPVRAKLIAAMPEFLSVSSEDEIARFVRAVLQYFPTGDLITGSGTSATTLIQELRKLDRDSEAPEPDIEFAPFERVLGSVWLHERLEESKKPWDNDSYRCIEFFIERHRERWKMVCEAMATAKATLARRS